MIPRAGRQILSELELAGGHAVDKRGPLLFSERECGILRLLGVPDQIPVADPGDLDAGAIGAMAARAPCGMLYCIHC
jgi:hypothetical protein